ncbi:MAG: hypothetical protein V4718_04485 [Pseudomonadota bacterium]
MRGIQLGHAIGAKVIPHATLADCNAADMIVGVKRIPGGVLNAIRKSGKPWVYDIVDAYPQPQCSTWTQGQALDWLQGHIEALSPTAVIWPTARMQVDFGGGGTVIYHHHRHRIQRNPIRERIEVIGYEGSANFLEGWMPAIISECERIGARFVINPVSLADVDVVLALRGPIWSGYPQANWKSNVKLANAHGSGTPFIGMPEAGYEETASGHECWVQTPEDLRQALDHLQPQAVRQEIAAGFVQRALSVGKVAKQYRKMLCALKS